MVISVHSVPFVEVSKVPECPTAANNIALPISRRTLGGFTLELSTITFSLKVTFIVMLSFILYAPSELEEETEETVGAVVSTTKVLTLNALLAFPVESVTVMVQL